MTGSTMGVLAGLAMSLAAAAQDNIAPPGNWGHSGDELTIIQATATTATLSCTPGHYFVGNSPPVETLLEDYIVKVSSTAPGENLADWFDDIATAVPMSWVGTPDWELPSTFEVTGLAPSTTYYIAIAGFDDLDNRSAIIDVWNFTDGLVTAAAPPPTPTPTPPADPVLPVTFDDDQGAGSWGCAARASSGWVLLLLGTFTAAARRSRMA